MLDFFLLLLSFFSLLSISCAATLYLNIKTGLAPFITLCLATAVLSLSAMVGDAAIAAVGILSVGAAAFVAVTIKIVKDRGLIARFYDIGFISFALLSLFIISLFSIRQPLFYEWDEFSFWGTAARVVSDSNLLYTVADNNMVGITHPPALIMISYFFNFLGEFAPYKTYIGYDILIFSGMGAVVSCFEQRLKNFSIATLLLFVCSPFIAMNLYGRSVQLLPGYMSAYADYPMGILLAGALVVYYCSYNKKAQALFASGCALFVLTLSKEMGFAFAMLGAGIIAADLIIADREFSLLKRIIASVALIATPVIAFSSWSMHLAAAAGVNRFEVGGEQNLGMVELLLTGVYELFIPSARTEKFTAVFTNLLNVFIHGKVMLIGSGLVVLLSVTVLMVTAFIFTENNKKRLSIIIYYVMTWLGCLAYTVFLGFTYVYVFKGDDGIGLVSYERYVMPYYTAWLLASITYALFLLRLKPRFSFIIQPAMIIAVCGLFLFTHYITPSHYNYLNYPDSYFSAQREIKDKVDVAKQYFEEESDVFYMHSADNGIGWFQNYYYFLPMHIDYSGGGDLARYDAESLAQHLIDNEIDIVYVDYLDNVAEPNYISLFADDLVEYKEGRTYIYSVVQNNDGVTLVPIAMEG